MNMSKLLMTLMLGACCSAGAAEVVAFWPFGTNGLNDVSGNGHTLTASANVAVDDAVTLDGTQTSFDTVAPLNLSSYDAVTIEFWTRLEPNANTSGAAGTADMSGLSPQGLRIFPKRHGICIFGRMSG